jgi:hypothetical protein
MHTKLIMFKWAVFFRHDDCQLKSYLNDILVKMTDAKANEII